MILEVANFPSRTRNKFILFKILINDFSMGLRNVIRKINVTDRFYSSSRLGGATVARGIPNPEVACSNHVRVNSFFFITD